MKKNFQIHLRIETEVIEALRKQAQECGTSLGELCRQKIRGHSHLSKIESLLLDIKKELNNQKEVK